MDRRKYLKTLAVGTAAAGTILQACGPNDKPQPVATQPGMPAFDRQPEEKARYEKLMAEKFFTDPEMKTLRVLADIIIPRDDISGSATDAGVPDFIEFIVKDMPRHQLPMRGGLAWLDAQCRQRFGSDFVACSSPQQIEMVDEIAFPERATPEMKAGVRFFNLMRDLTATGFYTSEIGIKDLGYAGNTPNQWDGVPQDVLDQYGLKYDERTLKESVKFS
jgi:hypothetical protein